MDDFIVEFSGAATPEFCEMIIKRYESDIRKRRALIGPNAEYIKEVRDSINVEINRYPEWGPIVDDIRNMIYSRLHIYIETVHSGLTKSLWSGGYDSDYIVMKYEPDGHGYSWHNDFMYDIDYGGVRTITWLFYLNDCEGGETEFRNGPKVSCETGKLVLFPSDWTMVHRGLPPIGGPKYLAVGWIMSKWNKELDKAK